MVLREEYELSLGGLSNTMSWLDALMASVQSTDASGTITAIAVARRIVTQELIN